MAIIFNTPPGAARAFLLTEQNTPISIDILPFAAGSKGIATGANLQAVLSDTGFGYITSTSGRLGKYTGGSIDVNGIAFNRTCKSSDAVAFSGNGLVPLISWFNDYSLNKNAVNAVEASIGDGPDAIKMRGRLGGLTWNLYDDSPTVVPFWSWRMTVELDFDPDARG